MSRKEQLDELLKNQLSEILSKESLFPDGLITITKVDCSPDLQNAKILISVLPDHKSGSALKALRSNSHIGKALGQQKILRKMPKLNWQIDSLEKHAFELEEYMQKIKEEEE